jgi:hypothetical protein
MNAVAGDGSMQHSAVAEVDGHCRHGALRGPVEDEMIAEIRGDLTIRIEHRAEVAAVRAAHLHAEVAEEAEREDRAVGCLGGRFGRVEIGVPVKAGEDAVGLAADAIERGAESRFGCGVAGDMRMRREHGIDGRLTGRAQLRDRGRGDSWIGTDGAEHERIRSAQTEDSGQQEHGSGEHQILPFFRLRRRVVEGETLRWGAASRARAEHVDEALG